MTVFTRAGKLLALAIVLFAQHTVAAGAAEGSDAIKAAVDRAFRPLLKEHDVPGMAVAVTVQGQRHFFNYGVASRADNIPVTENTLFEIGSVSKTFTATLVSYARALGKISLGDHPAKYMPQLQGSDIDRANLLNLGTYTAGGLPLQFPSEVGSAAEMNGYFRQWKPSFAPGTHRQYSNPSLGLFGHMTSLAMGGNFADLMEQELFPKLGLSHSYIRVPDAEMSNYAWGEKNGKPMRVSPGVLDAETYGVKSSAADLIRFVEANIGPESFDPPLRRAIEDTHIGYFRIGEMVQGLGWEQYPYPLALERLLSGNSKKMILEANLATKIASPQVPAEPTLFNKTGSTYGFGAYVAFVPEKKIGVVMLANKNFPNAARITAAYAVLEQLSGEGK